MPEIKSQYQTGEKAPDGVYTCMSCEGNNPVTITLRYKGDDPDEGKALPYCKKCGYTYWYRVT